MSLLLSCIQVRGGRREEDSGLGTRVYLWQIHVDIWQNQYNIVNLKNFLKKEMDNQQRPTVQHRELCSILCNNLSGKEFGKE